MGELREAQKTEGVLTKTHIGGQALIEGIMMRGRFNWAVAIRQPDGTIYTESHDLASGKEKNRWMYRPVVRGCTALVESLTIGYKALDIAGNHAYDFSEDEEEEEGTGSAAEQALETLDVEPTAASIASALHEEVPAGEEKAGELAPSTVDAADKPAEADEDKDDEGLPAGVMTVSMIIGLVLGIVLFVVAPAFITNLIMGDYGEHTLAWNIVDGLLRVAIFIGYIWAISRMKDIKRMFAYHGAEHKTIHCYEHGLELTPENAQQFPRLHVRCGTAFMITVMIVAILVFTIVPINAIIDACGVVNPGFRLFWVIVSRIILIPVVAGLSYEVTVKWAGSHPDNPFVKVVLWPGMQMQRLTTNPPDDSMLECAIAAMQIVIERERQEAEAGNADAVMPLSPCEVAAAKAERQAS